MPRSNIKSKDDNKEHSESDKKKARAVTQVRPENCHVATGGSRPQMPDKFEELMKIASKYYKVVDYSTLFNTEPLNFDSDPVDTSIDRAALEGEPSDKTGPAPVDPQKQAAILKRQQEWAEYQKIEDEKSAEEKEQEEAELEEMKIEFQEACKQFYGDRWKGM